MHDNYKFYRITEASEIKVGAYCLEIFSPSDSVMEQTAVEVKNWKLMRYEKYRSEDLSYNDVKEGTTEKEETISSVVLLKDKFVGVLISITDTDSYGMSVHQRKDYGLLMTDGTSAGKTSEHFSHCSTEYDEESDICYSLIRK